jgi:hypothetical protein
VLRERSVDEHFCYYTTESLGAVTMKKSLYIAALCMHSLNIHFPSLYPTKNGTLSYTGIRDVWINTSHTVTVTLKGGGMLCLSNQTTNTDVKTAHNSDCNSIWVWGWSIILTTIHALFLSLIFVLLTLILLTWRIWWAPNNASKWQMGFNSVFKGLNAHKGKGNGVPVQTTKAYRGTRGTAPLTLCRWLTDWLHTLTTLFPGRNPSTQWTGSVGSFGEAKTSTTKC